MKKLFIAFLMLAFVGFGTLSAQQWEEVTSGTTKILYGMCVPPGNSNVAYACGMQGTYNGPGEVIKSEDGGLTWTSIFPTSGEIDGLEAIYFLDEDTGFAGGWNNYFIKTTDGGATWDEVTVGTGVWYFVDIDFWDEDNGVACANMETGGQPVFITDDGGATWTQATSGITQSPLDITYADANTVYLVGTGGKISRSTDGGYTWSDIYTASGMTMGVDFAGTSFGVVSGEDGLMLATQDGGSTWSSYSTGSGNYYAAQAFTGDSAYLGGTDEVMYKTTDGGATWSLMYNGSGTTALYNYVFSDGGTGLCSGSQGKIFYREADLNAAFEADQTTVCVGSDVDFTSLSGAATSWDWDFPGGTPSSSTEQNPTITYNTAGTYNVELTVSDGVNNITELKVGYITVLETPGQASTPDGEIEICSNGIYSYSIDPIDGADDYEWVIDPEEAGTLVWVDNVASVETFEDWTGDFTLKARASNQCGGGDWSDELTVSVFQSPSGYTLEGGGEYCLNGEGVEITLDGSDVGISYELYLEGDATGNIAEGTGSEISFGLLTDEGSYSCVGSNDNCLADMYEQVEVIILYAPSEPGLPSGPTLICNMANSEYTSSGTDDADGYTWELLPEEAGILTPDGLSASVEWDPEFEGTATLSILGENECGIGNASELDIQVASQPEPYISGEQMVCDLQEETYTVIEDAGSTYTWSITGGTITDGNGTYMVSVIWGEPGVGTLSVEQETASGCSGVSVAFNVTIDDCTGINETMISNSLNIFPNPVNQNLNIEFNSPTEADYDIIIVNQLGQFVLQKTYSVSTGKSTIQLDLSNIIKGVYIMQLRKEGATITSKQFLKN